MATADQIRSTWIEKATAEAARLIASEARRPGRSNPQRAAYGERLAKAAAIAPTLTDERFWLGNRIVFEAGPLTNTRGADLVLEATR